MIDFREINLFGFYLLDMWNLFFNKKRAIRAMFIGESGRFISRVLVPAKDARKGEEITWRGGTYAFSKETALLDTSGYLPFCVYQAGNPQPLPINTLTKEDFLKTFIELGGKTAQQYKKAFQAKLVEDLLYQANADTHEKIKQIWIMCIVIIAMLALIAYYGYQAIHDIDLQLQAMTGIKVATGAATGGH